MKRLSYNDACTDISFVQEEIDHCQDILNRLGLGAIEDCRIIMPESHVILIPVITRPNTLLKISRCPNSFYRVAEEADRLQALEKSNFKIMRVPKILERGHGYTLTDMQGPDLEEVWRNNEPSDKIFEELGTMLGEAQAELWKKFGFIHDDIKESNLTHEGGNQYGLIDFESVEFEDPAGFMRDILYCTHVKLLVPAAASFHKRTGIHLDVEGLIKEASEDSWLRGKPELSEALEAWHQTQRSKIACRDTKKQTASSILQT